jgi:anion-transporting  ArsA/GET3 family ATPase
VAGAIALALAAGGQRVLLVEVEGRGGLARLFDVPPLGYEQQRLAAAPGGGEVLGLAVDPEEALLEYLELFYKMRRAGSLLRRFGAVDFATTIAPGLRDVLLTGKVAEATRRREGDPKGRDHSRPFLYVAIVMDAPPTGRVVRFLTVTTEVSDLARVGPIRNQADMVMGVFRSAETVIHLVTLLEEMPVQETLDALGELRHAGHTVGSIVVNMSRRGEWPVQPIDEPTLQELLPTVGIAPDQTVLDGLARLVADHLVRVGLEDEARARLAESGLPLVELPFLPEGVDVGALYGLATAIKEGWA